MKSYFIQDREFTKSELELWAWRRLPFAEGWEKSNLLFVLQWLSSVDSMPVKTSGSTGSPKPLLLQKKNMTLSARMTSTFFNLPINTSALLCLPSAFIAGKMMIVRALVNEWRLRWIQPNANPLELFDDKINFAAFTPMQVENSLVNNWQKFNLIDTVLIGGTGISESLEKQLSSCTNKCIATYGMTETITHVAYRNINGNDATTHYNALPGVTFRIDDRACLCVSATHLESEVITNDLVDLLNDTQFILLGRIDHVINSGGIKLFPEKIESTISSLIPVKFFIHGKIDAYLGNKAILYIEGWPLSDEKTDEIIRKIKDVLPPTEVPKEVEFVLKFDLTETGKIIRKNY